MKQAMISARDALDAAEVPIEGRWAWINERKWKHRQKMERKDLDRDERCALRAAQYERMKAAAPLTVERMRKWLKSPYAFR